MSDGSTAAEFDFTALGWLLFQGLCSDLVEAACGVAESAWVGDADVARWVGVNGSAARSFLGHTVDGRVELRVVWMPRSMGSLRDPRKRIGEAMSQGDAGTAGPVVVMTNASPTDGFRSLIRSFVPTGVEVVVLGRLELGRLVDSRPEAWLRLPSLLGVRPLDDLVDRRVLSASRFDVAAARALAPTFVPTAAYRRFSDVVERHGFAVLTGPPEMGKTAAARMLALVQLCRGWEVHECTDPDQLWRAFSDDRSQVFIADDTFGSTEYRPDTAERWALELDRILKHMDERHWLVWTSRPAPLHAGLHRVHREHGVERFPSPAQVLVDAADLTIEEKALMLYRHALAADASTSDRRALRVWSAGIVGHPHFTPERIRRFVWTRLPELAADPESGVWFRDAVESELAEPTEAMRASLHALDADHRDLLVAMLDAPTPPVAERDLAAAARRQGAGLGRPMPVLIDRLADHFLRPVAPASVAWVHPSWRDLVIDRLAADAAGRRAFLERCGIEGLLLALSTGGGPLGERALPFLVADADWDALHAHAGAVVAELGDTDRTRLMRQVVEAIWDRADHADVHALAELAALGAGVLSVTRTTPIDAAALGVLDAWYALADLVDEPPPPPDVTTLWVETLPTDAIDLADAADRMSLETWATLATVLSARDPAALQRFGHPAAQADVIGRIFAAAPAGLTAGEALRGTARALAPLFPMHSRRLRQFARDIAPPGEPTPEPPVRHLPPSGATTPRGSVVGRVLADLEPPARRPSQRWRRRR